jgi:hypothetical protein
MTGRESLAAAMWSRIQRTQVRTPNLAGPQDVHIVKQAKFCAALFRARGGGFVSLGVSVPIRGWRPVSVTPAEPLHPGDAGIAAEPNAPILGGGASVMQV